MLDLARYVTAVREISHHAGVEPEALVIGQGLIDAPDVPDGTAVDVLWTHLLLISRELAEIPLEELAELDPERAATAKEIAKLVRHGVNQ